MQSTTNPSRRVAGGSYVLLCNTLAPRWSGQVGVQAQESEQPTKRARRVSATAAQTLMGPPTAALPPIIEEEEEGLDEAPAPPMVKPRQTRGR
jgi:hypothetical protein